MAKLQKAGHEQTTIRHAVWSVKIGISLELGAWDLEFMPQASGA
jgi:hypothetical protein